MTALAVESGLTPREPWECAELASIVRVDAAKRNLKPFRILGLPRILVGQKSI
jgi:hypothetical protein